MGRIQVLDERTANQIAAGEVVERPASVVKELAENSLDADARRITVEIDGGGRDLIRVSDDGCGMSPDDARLSLQRHATSKIRTADDLLAVSTMGFRGEAIPSIASVSRLEMISQEPNQLSGYRILIDGGRIVEEGEFGAPPGTRITVRDLFFNVPARLKYLKNSATEMGQISDILTRLALSNSEVAFRVIANQSQVFSTPGTGRVLDAAVGLLGRDLVKELLPIDYTEDSVRITGYVGRPGAARAGRNYQFFFVNRRSIRTFALRYSLEEAYAHLIPNGRYPVCLLFLEVPGPEVDVNVHPAKAEVRFEREREIRGAVYKATRASLGAHLLIPGTMISGDGEVSVPDRAGERAAAQGGGGWVPPGANRPGEGGGRLDVDGSNKQVSFRLHGAQTSQETLTDYGLPDGGLRGLLDRKQPATEGEASGLTWTDQPAQPTDAELIRSLRPLGQVHRSYIACDGPDGLYLIDQHAAHERIFFERLLFLAQSAQAPVQLLLFPIALDLSPAQAALWREHGAILAESGFETEPFGGSTLLIKGVPAGTAEGQTPRLVTDFLDRLQEQRIGPTMPITERRQRIMAAMAACKAAIKAKDGLQPEDVKALLSDLADCQSPTTCPHGRPTVVAVSISELEKRFKR